MKTQFTLAVLLLAFVSPSNVCTAQTRALANRSAEPDTAEIDKTITLDGLIEHGEQSSWSTSKGVAVEGYAVQIEKELDGDYHLVLATHANENDASKWVIAEVTPQWRKKSSSLSEDHLRTLFGFKVRVTGWLYYDSNEKEPDPRGTKWEIHPVTNLEVVQAG